MFKLRSLNTLKEKRARINVDGKVWTIRATRSNGDLFLTRGAGGRRRDMIYSPAALA